MKSCKIVLRLLIHNGSLIQVPGQRRNTILIKCINLQSLGPKDSAHTIFRSGNWLFTVTRAVPNTLSHIVGYLIAVTLVCLIEKISNLWGISSRGTSPKPSPSHRRTVSASLATHSLLFPVAPPPPTLTPNPGSAWRLMSLIPAFL